MSTGDRADSRRPGSWPYENIVNLPHHVSERHLPMPLEKRAAQFAPFASLTTYEGVIEEAGRLTDEETELTENMLDSLDLVLTEAAALSREVTVTYFVPDEKKTGGSYRQAAGKIKKAEMGEIVMESGLRIPAERVAGIEISR